MVTVEMKLTPMLVPDNAVYNLDALSVQAIKLSSVTTALLIVEAQENMTATSIGKARLTPTAFLQVKKFSVYNTDLFESPQLQILIVTLSF